MKPSVVIPAWCWDQATVGLLAGAIANLRETAGQDIELIVVYAGIPDGERVAAQADVCLIVNPPQGWAAATNIGLLRARGDYIAVGSVDIRLPAGWLPALVDQARNDGIASPLDYKDDGVTWRRWDRDMRGSFWGAFFLFPRAILEDIGFLDGYTMRRMADMDWAIRARKAGYRTVRANVRAKHVAPHHTLRAHPDPHDKIVRRAFMERHDGFDRLGSWEGLPR